MAKGLRCGEEGRGGVLPLFRGTRLESEEVEEEWVWEKPPVPAGDAGSAAARARKTACVERERSWALGLARRAKACRTFWMSFRLILVNR